MRGASWILATCATLSACGDGGTSTQTCAPSCVALQCGDDGCGGSCGACAGGALCRGGACVAVCAPDCAGRVCGDDGCGGSCGACGADASCVQGSCQPLPASPGCPQGGTCTYLDRSAWSYDCTSPTSCVPRTVISTYGSFEACQTWGCMGGNSRCGDQHGNSDAERWSCEQCRVTCNAGISTLCGAAHETADGCRLEDSTWGEYLASCICR